MLVCDKKQKNYLFLVPRLTTIYRILKNDYSLEERCHHSTKKETIKMFPADI